MGWSKRDKDMAVRHMGPGAKVGIFLFVLVAVGAIAVVGWKYVSTNLMDSAAKLPEQVVAGETFEPGAKVDMYGTKTEAVLDGVSQRVQATNPTKEWKDSLEEVKCSKDNTCTAKAPATASMNGAEGGGGFLNTGFTLGGLVGLALLTWIAYIILNEEN